MANKSVTFTEPTATELNTLMIVCSAGGADSMTISAAIATDDPLAQHDGAVKLLPTDLSATGQTALATLLTEALTTYKTSMGF